MIELAIEEGVWTVTINRPEKANSLTATMLGELADIAERAATEGARALILTGTGRVFSAGADLEEAHAGLATNPVWERLSGAIAALPCLTIAALNGTVAGGAMGMVLACDLRISVAGAKVFYPVMRLGFLPQPSDVPRLVRLIGPARASMILMAGQKITAAEAQTWGLIDRVVDEDVVTLAHTLAGDALAAAPAHASAIKRMIWGLAL
ncbi:enoyl-CoA hydratase/isomerase family protein [Pseudorhodobacter turbinis]|uniref:Enoyl-CoA hydratase/isomerase family protein n=1 Tax=Pseudorhodobacter turbinis TaxID=2500533 RepID=A0A4P8EGD1_9RHOB|nr:enoyl-CoA hydratase/isomerase family protein [Pseudorhodobacter turbinis]QCO55782.1 enoyl-CoA hydratase/isomerase family protein [Pseudorhodobacter turbinis]